MAKSGNSAGIPQRTGSLNDPNHQADSKVGRRQHPRLRLAIEARLITTWGQYLVRLENLSLTGAHVSRPRTEKFGRCVLKWYEYETWGELVWMRGTYCGIRFDRELPEKLVIQTRSRATDIPEIWKLPTLSRLRSI